MEKLRDTVFSDFLFHLYFTDSGMMWGSSCLPECCRKRESPHLLCLCLVSSHSLKMRTFSTFDFYRKHEDAMTPAGLVFFQCQWDSSVTWVFHQLLSKKCRVQGCWRGPICGLGRGPVGNAQGQGASCGRRLLLGPGPCLGSLTARTEYLLSHPPPN